MYQALYRKWRPQSFDDVVGQNQVTDTLKSQIKNGRLSHAYLFIGTRGTGKTTCARILAKAVNCEAPENGNPCNRCKSCRGIDEGSVPDVVELDAASNNGVDNVRALRDEAIFSPAMAKKRVYIIDEVHMLSTAAFNALLKILEEPPEHLLFILATTELQKVPATILSRCQRHSFRRIEPELLAQQISYVAGQEGMTVAPEAAELLARLADGSMRDGLSLLDQCAGDGNLSLDSVLSSMGLAGNLRIEELLKAISSQDTESALYIFEGLWNDGKAPASLLSELAALMRDVLMLKVAPRGGSGLISAGFTRQSLEAFSTQLRNDWLIFGVDTLQTSLSSLRDGRDPRTVAELCLIRLCEPELREGTEALQLRVAKLEGALASGAATALPREEKKLSPMRDAASKPRMAARPQLEPKEEELPPFDLEEPPVVSKSDIPAGSSSNFISDPDIPSVQTPEAPNAAPQETYTEPAPFDDEAAPPETAAETAFDEEEAQAPMAEATEGDFWTGLLTLLSRTMQPGQYSIISSSLMATGERSGNSLTVYAANPFVKGQLEQNTAMDAIRAAAQELCGCPIVVKISEKKPEPSNGAGLDGLSKFGIVQFE